MTLLTQLTSFIAESLLNNSTVSGEVMDTQSHKVFRFRGKASVVRKGENPITYVSITEVEKPSPHNKQYVLVDVESAEEVVSEKSEPAKPTLSYHNLWKF